MGIPTYTALIENLNTQFKIFGSYLNTIYLTRVIKMFLLLIVNHFDVLDLPKNNTQYVL